MNTNNIVTTVKKELRGIIRDKQSLRSILSYPLTISLMVLLFGFLFSIIYETEYTVGINYEMTKEEISIVAELEGIKFKQYANEKELEKAYENKEISGYIIKQNEKYTVYANELKASGNVVFSMSKSYLESYNNFLGSRYLTENNIDSQKAFGNLTVEMSYLAGNEFPYDIIIIVGSISSFIIVSISSICNIISADITTGEKERGTMETILTFPVKVSELIVGKYIAASISGFAVGMITYIFAILTFALGKNPLHLYDSIPIELSLSSVALTILIILISTLLSSGISFAVYGKAKSCKEGHSSGQIISLIPLVSYFLNLAEADGFYCALIPSANCSDLLNDIMIGNLNVKFLIIVIVSTIVYITAILTLVTKQYKKENTLF